MNTEGKGMMGCKCPHHKTKAIVILVIGVLFLLQAIDILSASFVSIAWPVVLIIGALTKLCGNMCKCCDGKGGMGHEDK